MGLLNFNKKDKKEKKELTPRQKALTVVALFVLLLLIINTVGNNIITSSGSGKGFNLIPGFMKHLKDNEPKETKSETKTDNSKVSSSSSIKETDFVFKVVNVGQGECVYMSCEGESALYDGGEYSFRMKKPEYNKDRDEVLDKVNDFKYVFLSHYDSDHAGGLVDIIYKKNIKTFIKPNYVGDTKTYKNIINALKDKHIKTVKAKAKKNFKLGSANIEIISANKNAYDENDRSTVIKVYHGNVSYMITGDLTNYGEYQLAKYEDTKAKLKSNVLVVGHHGSNASSNIDFLSEVLPNYAAVPVGENSYGHPASSTLVNLNSVKAKILRTDKTGTITFWDDKNTLYVEK